MTDHENRAVGANDGAAEGLDQATSGPSFSDNASASNSQWDDAPIPTREAAGLPPNTKTHSVAFQFLDKLRPGGPWLLTAIDPDPPADAKERDKITSRHVTTAGEVEEFVARHNGKWNLYYSVNPTRRTGHKKATKAEISAIEFVLSDCDPNDDETPAAAKVRYLAGIKTLGIPHPTAIVDSGNGIQLLWRLDPSIELPDPISAVKEGKTVLVLSKDGEAAIADSEGRVKANMEKLGTKAGTQNIDRILRLPGTVNLPNKPKRDRGRVPCDATLIEFNKSVHSLSAFPAPAPDNARRGGAKKAAKPTATPRERARPNSAASSPLNVDDLRVSARIKTIITTGSDPTDPARGRSECVYKALLALMGAGYEGSEVEHFFLDAAYPISAHILDQPKPSEYFERQVEKCKAETTSEIDVAVAKLNETHCFVVEGGRAVVLRKATHWGRKTYERIPPADFKLAHANNKFTVWGRRGPQEVGIGDIWLNDPNRRQFINGVVFDPSGKQSGEGVLNLWEGFRYEPKPGSWSLLQEHTRTNICNGNQDHFDYLMSSTARAVQRPAEQGHVAVVVRGGEGVGKGIWGRTVASLFGQHGLQISNGKHLVGNFNSYLRDCCFLFADEAFFAGDKQHVSVLKALITEPTLTIEAKYQNAVSSPNYIHLFMASNDDWVVPAAIDARRFFVLEAAPHRANDHEYFGKIQAELENGGYEAMLHDLLTRDISKFEVRAFPNTAALQDQKRHSFAQDFQWWQDVLMRGYIWQSQLSLEGVFSRWMVEATTELLWRSYEKYVKDRRERIKHNRVHFGRFMSKLGTGVQIKEGVLGEHIEKLARAAPLKAEGRPSGYRLGSLSEARAAFDTLTGVSTEWPKGDGTVGGETEQGDLPF